MQKKEKPWLTIIGVGENNSLFLLPEAKKNLAEARYIFGATRHIKRVLQNLSFSKDVQFFKWPKPFLNVIPHLKSLQGEKVVLLATGDPMFFGVGSSFVNYFHKNEMIIYPYLSSFSLAASCLKWALQDVICCSIHGRPLDSIFKYLKEKQKIFILSHDKETPHIVAAYLNKNNYDSDKMIILEELGSKKEQQILYRDAIKKKHVFSDLNLVAIECFKKTPNLLKMKEESDLRFGILPDKFYFHDGQMTKQNIRAINLLYLEPKKNEILWDIGSGCGSIAIEWLRSTNNQSRVFAFEKNLDRIHYIKKNSYLIDPKKLTIMPGCAFKNLENLISPDAIFIGGGFTDFQLVEKAWELLKVGGRFIANAITIETENLFHQFSKKYKNQQCEILKIQLNQIKSIGRFHKWEPSLPVTLLVCQKIF